MFKLSFISALLASLSVVACHNSDPGPECLVPTSKPFEDQGLAPVSYSFDLYFPQAISRYDGRIALHARHTESGFSGQYAARVWTGSEWQTWDLLGTTSGGGLGLSNFRLLNAGGKITAFAAATIGSTAGTYVYEENDTHNGFSAPTLVSGLSGSLVLETGGLDSSGQSAALASGTLSPGTTSSIVIIEKTGLSWSASAVRPLLTPLTATLKAEAVGFHLDGTPWVVYSETPSGSSTRTFKITRRVGLSWQAGVTIATGVSLLDSTRLDTAFYDIEGGSKFAVFYWSIYAGGNTQLSTISYDLNTRTLGTLETLLSTPSSCSNCVSANLAYSQDGITGIAVARDTTYGQAWLAHVDHTSFSPVHELFPDYAVSGSVMPYYDACNHPIVTFIGRPASLPAAALDFYALPVDN